AAWPPTRRRTDSHRLGDRYDAKRHRRARSRNSRVLGYPACWPGISRRHHLRGILDRRKATIAESPRNRGDRNQGNQPEGGDRSDDAAQNRNSGVPRGSRHMTGTPLREERQLILNTVRQFVAKEVIPVASELEHRDEYPHPLVEQMKEIGL